MASGTLNLCPDGESPSERTISRETVQVPYHNFKWTVSLLPELPDRSRTILFDELLDYFLEVWIPCAKSPREPVSAALGNFFASRYNVELASLARGTDSFNV
jgi:hypothetical protein